MQRHKRLTCPGFQVQHNTKAIDQSLLLTSIVIQISFPTKNDSILHFYSTCQHTGYSQSRSKPSNLNFSINSRTLEINLLLALGSLTNRLYLLPSDSFQPPMAIKTLGPLLFNDETCSKSFKFRCF